MIDSTLPDRRDGEHNGEREREADGERGGERDGDGDGPLVARQEPPAADRGAGGLPRPHVRRSRWPSLLVWLIPLLAAAGAGYYLWNVYRHHGVEITIIFEDVNGVKVRDTPLSYHGVRVGSVASIDLDPDRTHALLRVQVERAFEQTIARDGGRFWIVRPDIGGGMLTGLNTVISGPYIEVDPGQGDPAYQFTGRERKPILVGDGLRVILHTDRLAKLQVDSPVFYRGMQVGAIQDIRFSSDARQVNVTAFVWQRYANLLRRTTRFWTVSGTDIKGGLFSGIQVELGSLKALVAGGVSFATPSEDDPPVVDGQPFALEEGAKDEWLAWSPKILLPDDPSPGAASKSGSGESGSGAAQPSQ